MEPKLDFTNNTRESSPCSGCATKLGANRLCNKAKGGWQLNGCLLSLKLYSIRQPTFHKSAGRPMADFKDGCWTDRHFMAVEPKIFSQAIVAESFYNRKSVNIT